MTFHGTHLLQSKECADVEVASETQEVEEKSGHEETAVEMPASSLSRIVHVGPLSPRDRADSNQDEPLMPPDPPATVIPGHHFWGPGIERTFSGKKPTKEVPREPTDELKLARSKSASPCKPQILTEESWLQPPSCPKAGGFGQAGKPVSGLLLEESSRQTSPNAYFREQAEGSEMGCSSLHELLQQVELQHLREIDSVRAELEKQLIVRTELESRLGDLRQAVHDPECKELLHRLLQQLLQFADQDVSQDQRSKQVQSLKTPCLKDTVDLVEFRSELHGESDDKPSTPPLIYGCASTQLIQNDVRAAKTNCSAKSLVSTNTGYTTGSFVGKPSAGYASWALEDIKHRIAPSHRWKDSIRRSIEGSTFEGLVGRLSKLVETPSHEDDPDVHEAFGIRRAIRALVQQPCFDTFCSVVIMLSAVLLGFSTDLTARTKDPNSMPEFYFYADYTFTTWFLVELCLRMFAAGIIRFFFGETWNWNVFDFAVVSIDLANTIYGFAAKSSDGNTHLSITRVARVLKLARTLRMMRLFRFLRELRKMVLSIMRSGLHLFYSFILLCIVIFMFSIYLTQSISFYLMDHLGENCETNDRLQEYFGSLIEAGYTLFLCITTGLAWGDVNKPLIKVHWSNGCILAFFMFFTIFAVLNMITGVFVDSALTSAQNERDEKINNALEMETELVAQLQEFFGQADQDKSGAISLDELKEQIKQPKVRAQLRTLEIDLSDAKRIFTLLDTEKTGEVGIEEFIFGCLKMKGNAKSIDLITMMHQMKSLKTMVRTSFKDINERFKHQQKFQAELAKVISNQNKVDELARINAGWKPGVLPPSGVLSPSGILSPRTLGSSSNFSRPHRPPLLNGLSSLSSKKIQNGIEGLDGPRLDVQTTKSLVSATVSQPSLNGPASRAISNELEVVTISACPTINDSESGVVVGKASSISM